MFKSMEEFVNSFSFGELFFSINGELVLFFFLGRGKAPIIRTLKFILGS